MRTYFLLQNWWSYKQFIEVDDIYLENSVGTEVYFIKNPQTEIPTTFKANKGCYFEAADGADSGETEGEEGN